MTDQRTKYTKEQLNFIKQNYKSTVTTREELTKLFNKKFNSDKSVYAIMDTLRRYKITKDKKYFKKIVRKSRKKIESIYTKEQVNFIRKNYTENPSATRKNTLKLFNEKFNKNISIYVLGYIMTHYKLRRSRPGCAPIYTHKVKQFIKKCIEEGMTREVCRGACEKEFERTFNKDSIGQTANRMGLHFNPHQKKEIDKYLESIPKIEDIIRRVVKRNPKSKYHEILIRDMLIEKGYKNIKTIIIIDFCKAKKIKINYISLRVEQKREKQRRKAQQAKKKKKKLGEILDNEYEKYGEDV